jgi:hypothetical protein
MPAGDRSQDPRQAAIALWDRQLAQIPDPADWVLAQQQRCQQMQLVVDGQCAVRVARPNFVTAAGIANDQAVVAAVTRALAAAVEAVLADPELGDRTMGSMISGPTRALLDLPHDYGHHVTFGRYDGARRNDGLAILEFNGGLPGGVLGSDGAGALMRSWPPYARLVEEFEVAAPDLGAAIVQSLVSTWQGFGGTGLPRVLLAVPEQLRAYTAGAVGYLVRRCAEAGIEALVADPGQLTHVGGALRLRGEPVHVVIRVFFTTMLASLGARIAALVSAVAAGDVVMLTPFRSGLLGHKSLFALVSDPAVELQLEQPALELARAHLPWTRLLGAGMTTDPEGFRIDLGRFARSAAHRLVLKPADGTGGAGVVLGWECEPAQWEAALAAAARSGIWVLQDRVELVTETIPLLAAGFPTASFVVDHNPLVINDQVAGYFARMSPGGGVTNLTGGLGSTAPTFVVSGPRCDTLDEMGPQRRGIAL